MYKNIFFDLDDTLWFTLHNSREAFHEIYDNFKLSRFFDSFDHFYTIYLKRNNQLWAEYAKGTVTIEKINHDRFIYPLQTVGINDESLAKDYSDSFFKTLPSKKTLIPHAMELLEYLNGKGCYNLYILSNGFKSIQYQKLRSSGIDHYFDKVILSEDIGIPKPNIGIFNFAMSATNSEYTDSLMIGDSWVNDIYGARNAGMDQIYFNRLHDVNDAFKPTYEVDNLQEIMNIL